MRCLELLLHGSLVTFGPSFSAPDVVFSLSVCGARCRRLVCFLFKVCSEEGHVKRAYNDDICMVLVLGVGLCGVGQEGVSRRRGCVAECVCYLIDLNNTVWISSLWQVEPVGVFPIVMLSLGD